MNTYHFVGLILTIIVSTFAIMIVIYHQNRSLKNSHTLLTYITKSLKIKQDLEKLKNETAEVSEEVRLNSAIFYATQESVAILDENFKYLSVNPAFEERTGFSSAEIKGKDFNTLNSGNQEPEFYDDMYKKLKDAITLSADIWSRNKDCVAYMESVTISKILDSDDNVKNYLVVASDITDAKNNELKIMKIAKQDALTKLPNRSLFLDRLEFSIAASKRYKTVGAVMFLDLDHFKSLNDTLGHHVGDLLLIEIGKRLQKCVRETDTVARLGGDEFTVLLDTITRSEDAAVVAENIINEIIQEYNLNGNKIKVTCSLGIAIFPNDGVTVDSLIHSADQAMYNVKKEGRNQYKFYSSSLDTEAHRKKSLEKELLSAIKNDQFYLQYLPAYNKDQKIAYFDVLIRWNHPVLGDVKPNEFIPLAEESGLIMKITDWVMATAMKELKNDIDTLKQKNIKLSFKLSSVHFKQNDIVNNILEIIGAYNVSLIQIKIDEPIISKNLLEAKEKITNFMQTGFYVCIDDFGTGKISFLDILDLDFTSVKIPRELIKNVNENKSYAAAVKSLISLAKNLDSYITIEGIESKEQVDALSNYIDDKMFLQGHYFSKPLNVNEIKKIM